MFNQMLDRLETSFQQLSQVSADMAHDLRTPIANLLGQTEVALTQDRSTQYYTTLLGSNFEELLRLSRMIDSMLFLAQAQAQNASQALRCEHLNLAMVLPPLAEYFEGPAEERRLTLDYPLEVPCGLTAICCGARLPISWLTQSASPIATAPSGCAFRRSAMV
ncbi:MAG: histidine kinase dimerization/phospho-acceptor domain-containing protein [Sodalis sp. (in: enterobacteria)]|uniref:histidine kinase dimerization/phospho-acceptor domain-containing protein n=1 Tax=Sodalis sp. (in: enterobacteria) TaxID=1898979 RepID=UPI003F3EF008